MAQDSYHIRVKGHLSQQWCDWFDGFTIINAEHGETILSGSVADQAALHGLLSKIRDLGLPLLAVNLVEDEEVSYKNKDLERRDDSQESV